MEIKFISTTKLEINHGKHRIVSDQPVYGGGTDEGMTPVDMLISSLGACIGVFIAGILSRRKVDLSKCSVSLDWEMADSPRRVGNIAVKINLPEGLSETDKETVLKAANKCTVHNTLHHPPRNIDYACRETYAFAFILCCGLA